jgi:sulfur dioxygenase
MLFRQLFEPETSTDTYVLADDATKEAVIIDPVRETIERDVTLLHQLGLSLRYVMETHVHADHVTSAGLLRERTGTLTVVSKDGGAPCADVLPSDGDVIRCGALALEVRRTPGHTNGCVTYVEHTHKLAFTGDALLIRGCGRTDFQQGDPHTLYRSVHDRIFSLPDDTAIYPGHDNKGCTSSTVGEEKAFNPRLGRGISEAQFVALMGSLQLAVPQKMHEAVPANLRCGRPDPSLTQAFVDVDTGHATAR